jgi:hypothetical protein
MVRFRWLRLPAAAMIVVGTLAAIGLSEGSTPAAAATATPACTFNGGSLPLVEGASAGNTIAVDCTGLSPLHPYLVMEVSLLLGIDPKAAPLLDGDITSLSGLMALLSALPEINPDALAFPVSDLSGNLDENYTLPTTQAPDPNATCPPSTAEINMGLIGCGLAMIDLTTFKTVAAGSGLVEYTGDPLFPPAPTLALSTKKAAPGQVVNVSDALNAKTFWWLSTLTSLDSLLGGSAPPPVLTVTVKGRGLRDAVPNTVTVTPAVYNYPVLTPPVISGGFTVPAAAIGHVRVTVDYAATLLGFPLANKVSAPLLVKG